MKFWRDREGKRVYTTERARVSRMFRYHVNTRYNPRGRIYRMLCQFCPANSQKTISQFHHIDYALPFVGVWACESHHRKIEVGTTIIGAHHICDYTILVRPILRHATSKAMRGKTPRPKSNIPF